MNNNLLALDAENYQEEIIFYEDDCKEVVLPQKDEVVVITGSIIISP